MLRVKNVLFLLYVFLIHLFSLVDSLRFLDWRFWALPKTFKLLFIHCKKENIETFWWPSQIAAVWRTLGLIPAHFNSNQTAGEHKSSETLPWIPALWNSPVATHYFCQENRYGLMQFYDDFQSCSSVVISRHLSKCPSVSVGKLCVVAAVLSCSSYFSEVWHVPS